MRSRADAAFKTVDDHNRIGIPKHIADSVPWLTGKTAIEVSLLMLRADRCRLVTKADIESTPGLISMKEKIGESAASPHTTPLDFADDASTVFNLRLLDSLVSPPPPEWRIRLPKLVAELLRVRPGKEQAVIVLDRQFIEVWSMERFQDAFETTLITQSD